MYIPIYGLATRAANRVTGDEETYEDCEDDWA